jgi:ABC-type arginine transport system ATPase subunit
MSDDETLAGFTPPPFDAAAALQQMKRALRDLKLAERGDGFELRGKRVAELAQDGAVIRARIARRLMLTPEWDRFDIGSAVQQRAWIDQVKKRLERWQSEE